MRHTGYVVLFVLLSLGVLLAGCVPDSTPADVAEPSPWPTLALEGTEWLLIAVQGEPVVAGTAPTLAFHPNNYLEANSGCNYLGVDYATEGNAFTLAEIHRTAFDCAEPAGVADQDGAFFEAFERIAAYGATEDAFVFQDADGATLLEYARKRPPLVDVTLVDTAWVLTAINGQPPLEDTRITLNLGAEHYGGLAGCNSYGGTYLTASEGVLALGETAVTAMLCLEPERVMKQEQAYLEVLRQAAGYRVTASTLEILDAASTVILTYARQPSYDTDPAALIGTSWRATEADGVPLDDGVVATLVFYREGILGGQAGCRDHVGSYTMTGDNLAVLYQAMLDPGCDADALAGEGTLLNVLTDSAQVELDGERLILHGEHGGMATLEAMDPGAARPLAGSGWSLLGFLAPNGAVYSAQPIIMADPLLPGTRIDLTLADGTATGSAGCNRYTGQYTLSGESLAVEALGSTKMACQDPPGLMQQEGRCLETLQAVTTVRVYGERLWLETADGRALVYAAE